MPTCLDTPRRARPGGPVPRRSALGSGARFGRQAAFGASPGLGLCAAETAFAFFDLGEHSRAALVSEAAVGAVTDDHAVPLVQHERRRVAQRAAVEIEVQVLATESLEPPDLGRPQLHAP